MEGRLLMSETGTGQGQPKKDPPTRIGGWGSWKCESKSPRWLQFYRSVRRIWTPPCRITAAGSVLWGHKTARHPSVIPPVDPRDHVPPDVRGVPLDVGGDGELSWVPGQSL